MKFIYNVALNGRYLCRVENNYYEKEKQQAFKKQLQKAFPESEGYIIDLTEWRTVGQKINLD